MNGSYKVLLHSFGLLLALTIIRELKKVPLVCTRVEISTLFCLHANARQSREQCGETTVKIFNGNFAPLSILGSLSPCLSRKAVCLGKIRARDYVELALSSKLMAGPKSESVTLIGELVVGSQNSSVMITY